VSVGNGPTDQNVKWQSNEAGTVPSGNTGQASFVGQRRGEASGAKLD
jgi:hypothetical protein